MPPAQLLVLFSSRKTYPTWRARAPILLRLRYAPAPQNRRSPTLIAHCRSLTARRPTLIAPRHLQMRISPRPKESRLPATQPYPNRYFHSNT